MHISSVLLGLAALGVPLTAASAISHDVAYQSFVINTANGNVRGAPSPFHGGNTATSTKASLWLLHQQAPITGNLPKSRISEMACSIPPISALNARRLLVMSAFLQRQECHERGLLILEYLNANVQKYFGPHNQEPPCVFFFFGSTVTGSQAALETLSPVITRVWY